MKSFRRLLLPLCLALAHITLVAQTSAPAAKPLPVTSVAWLNSNEFINETTGIKQLVRVFKELELEFSGTESELSLLNEKLRTLVGELTKLQAGGEANAKAIQEKQAEGLKMQRELQAKQQQAQAAIGQAQQEKQAPISAEIGKALEAFAKEREIGLLFDLAKMNEGVIAAKPELDVTAEFITYYNAAHK